MAASAADEPVVPVPGSAAFHAAVGPQAEAVERLLARAARLTTAERRRIVDEANWRAWPITLPVGGGLAAGRQVARILAARAGRGAAVDLVAQAAAGAVGAGRDARRLAQAVADAALALMVHDLIDDGTEERLSGAWRHVIH
jgi:hypothetical protein